MINAIQLYGAFILTVLGFIVPILTILVSLFPEGVKSLAEKYENERKQSEENIRNETTKRDKIKDLDYSALEKTLKTLKKKKKDAESKLGYLKPIQFLLKISLPFLISFIAVLISLADINFSIKIILLISSGISLVAGFLALFTSVSVVFEVAEIMNQRKTSNEEKVIALLSTLVEKSGENPYLKEDEVEVKFHNKYLKENLKYDFSVDKKYDIPVSIHNKSDKMAKTVEVGFVFPKNVVIEKTNNLVITTTEEAQIVRFKEDGIQAHNDNLQGDIKLTFLESGKAEIDLFIKGENVKYRRFSFEVNIVK